MAAVSDGPERPLTRSHLGGADARANRTDGLHPSCSAIVSSRINEMEYENPMCDVTHQGQ